MEKKEPFIIAEIGVNHNGDIRLAKKLVEEAKNCGANAVKFQTFVTEKVVSKAAPLADYQKRDGISTQFQLLKSLELTNVEFKEIKSYCDQLGIEFLSTPDDLASLIFLVSELNISQIKIGSGEINNIPFLREISKIKLPIILSTGMSDLAEVKSAIQHLGAPKRDLLTVLHCTSLYPAPAEELNLLSIPFLRKKLGYDVGYSDHSLGSEAAKIAATLGATVFERHLTLDNSMEGPDHLASDNPENFRSYVKDIQNVLVMLGDAKKTPTEKELQMREKVRRKACASRNISKGTVFTADMLLFVRSVDGVKPESFDDIVGSTLLTDKKKGEPILESEVQWKQK